MSDPLDFKASVDSLPAADIKASDAQNQDSPFFTKRTFPVRITNEDREDFIMEIRASQLSKARGRLEKMSKSQFPWHELLLAVATTSLGAFLGGLAGNLVLTDDIGIIFLVIFPIIGAATFVAYFLLRKFEPINFSHSAQEILSELPDPKNTSDKRGPL